MTAVSVIESARRLPGAPDPLEVQVMPTPVRTPRRKAEQRAESLEQLLERADLASYVSKDAGGNRVTRWSTSISRKG